VLLLAIRAFCADLDVLVVVFHGAIFGSVIVVVVDAVSWFSMSLFLSVSQLLLLLLLLLLLSFLMSYFCLSLAHALFFGIRKNRMISPYRIIIRFSYSG